MQTQKSLKIISVLKKHILFLLYAFLRDLCGRDRFLTSYMRHYVFRYTMEEVLTFNVWQLYEQMVAPPPLFFLFVVEMGVQKCFKIEKRFWPLIFKVDADKLKVVNYI